MENLLRSRMFRQQFIMHSLYFIIILGLLFYQVGRQTIKELERQQMNLAQVYRDQLQNDLKGWHNAQKSTLTSFSFMLESMDDQTLQGNHVSELIKHILTAYPQIIDLVIADQSGTIVNHRNKTPVSSLGSIADRSYFQEALKNGESGGGFFANKKNGKLTMALSRRFTNLQGKTYVASLYVLFDAFLTNFALFSNAGFGSTFLLNPQGQVIYYSKNDDYITIDQKSLQGISLENSDLITLESNLYGSVSGAYFFMPELQIIALVVASPDLLVKPAQQLQIFVSILGLIAMLVSLLLSYWMTAQVYRPISELVHAVNQMAASNYNHKLTVQADGEIGVLIQSFNQMQEIVARRELSLKDTAQRDSLTNLINHGTFLELLNNSSMTRAAVSLVMLDIDHFKAVNDVYGHQAGDLVLKRLAEILVNNLRDRDIVARYGGEEFAIIPYNTGYEPMLCERLRRNVELADFVYNGIKIPVTISVGWSTIEITDKPDCDILCPALIAAADDALYKAKKNGRNQVVQGKSLSSISVISPVCDDPKNLAG
ncbi:diguanylate cyclase [Gracilinema caldarium]|uniref:sensor domain-containing diguanylate cyclase n=1 Tax=Gracilinema caldarium TaxID=215591 RepID=UPI0026F313A5|nr:diguanylate cyclase [Gracilinema caldarium]